MHLSLGHRNVINIESRERQSHLVIQNALCDNEKSIIIYNYNNDMCCIKVYVFTDSK